MTDIVMIRQFESPLSADDMHAAADATRWCLDLYNARPRLHYLARDGLRCLCVFDAPDAEAMRNVLRTSGFGEPLTLFAATVHAGPGDSGEGGTPPANGERTLALVERRFPQPVQFEDVDADEQRSAACFNLHRVNFLRSYFSTDRRRMICLYGAPDAEAVRNANRQSGLPFDSVWPAQVVMARSG